MTLRPLIAAALLFAPLAACAPSSPSTGSTESDVAEQEADALTGDTVYVVTRQDFRKCAAPMCGGVFVKAVNKQKTLCFDGTKQAECYVADVDVTALELPEQQASDVDGSITGGRILVSGQYEAVDSNFAKLAAFKAYEPRTGNEPTGTFYSAGSSGITCAKAPCPSIRAATLNSTKTKNLTGLDLGDLGISDEEIGAYSATVFETGLIFAGVIESFSTPQGNEKELVVSEVYTTIVAKETQQLCLTSDACGEGQHCDMTECFSNCAPGMVCPSVCWGQCLAGEAPVCPEASAICSAMCGGQGIDIPEGCPIPPCMCPPDVDPAPSSCVDACGGPSADASCHCDPECAGYGDCCADYAQACN